MVLPLRVIDIPATLANKGGICLTKPNEWNFYILSHTWSAAIRKLSEKIGKLIPAMGHAVDYNVAFENANFSDDPESNEAYEHLKELLSLLMKDGVERIWFDALCIDQTSKDEKSREISNMAAYYSGSQGCYALTFGVGRGYRLWSDVTEEMPRWFQRVWTFQEFMLPKKLTFIVEDLDARLVQMVERLSCTSWNSCLGFCKCCIPSDLLEFDPPSIREFLHQQSNGGMSGLPADRQSSSGAVVTVDSVDGVCPKCKKGMLVRGPICVNGKQIHLIDKEVYLFIVRAGIAISEGSTHKKHEEMLCGLFGLLEAADKVDPRLTILKIGERFCSHAEDRVLSILNLLGVTLESNEQLRTEKTLDEQIIEAAQRIHPNTLVLLFATDGVGYPTVGMSWAPNFHDTWESLICGWNDNSHCRVDRDTTKNMQWIGGIQCFQRKVEVQGVTRAGIKIACKKVNGYVRPICGGRSDPACTHDLFCSDGKHIMSLEASSWMFDSVPSEKLENDHVKCRVVDGKFRIIYLLSTTDHHSRFSVTVAAKVLPRDANKQTTKALAGLDVCLVLLGCNEEEGMDLVMVCLQDDKQELHKIGILALPVNQSNIIFGGRIIEECKIGGFGRDLSKYVSIEGPAARDDDQEQEERLYMVCKGLLCNPMGGPVVPHHVDPEILKTFHERLPIPEFESTKHLLNDQGPIMVLPQQSDKVKLCN